MEPTDKIQNENSSQLLDFSCFRFCVSDIKFSLKYLVLQYLGNYTLLRYSRVKKYVDIYMYVAVGPYFAI